MDAVRETHPELDWRESVVMHLKDAILSLREKGSRERDVFERV